MNVALRDLNKLQKLRVVKVIHAVIHRRVFIFYQKPQIFEDLSNVLITAFDFKQESNHSSPNTENDNLNDN